MSGAVQGTVVAITDAGNLVTSISAEQLEGAPTDERVTIACHGHETHGIFHPGHGQPQATLLAVLGPGGHLELEIVGLDASEMLGVRVGEKVVVSW